MALAFLHSASRELRDKTAEDQRTVLAKGIVWQMSCVPTLEQEANTGK